MDYTQDQINNWIAYTAAQPADSFVMGSARTVGDYWKANGFTQADLEQLARNGLAQGDFKAQYFGPDQTPWNDPNWPAKTAAYWAEQERQRQEAAAFAKLHPEITAGPGPADSLPSRSTTPSQRATASGIPATRDQVVNAFRNTPGANPQPDEQAITYYMGKGIAQLVQDVATIRKANPALAAQIDAQRRAMGLTTTTVTTSSTTATGGGTMALLLAAAAVYFLGS